MLKTHSLHQFSRKSSVLWWVFLSVGSLGLPSCGSRSLPIVIQAEQFNRGTVTIDNGEHGYGQGIGVIITPKAPAFAEYDFEVPKTANYDLELRYASAIARPVRVLADKQLITEHAADGDTGGFLPENQKWQSVGVLDLTRGKHTLRIESDFVFPHIDQIRLTETGRSVTKS
jgi:hypothetical protein